MPRTRTVKPVAIDHDGHAFTGETQIVEPTPASFEVAAATILDELRQTLAELVESLPESVGVAARAVDLERVLRVDKKLAWQVFRLVRSEGLGEVAKVPTPPAVRRLLAAARMQGVPEEVTRHVADVFERFERFAAAHGGDRQGLISMVAGIGGAGSDQYDQKVRQTLFRANAHVWGVQGRMQVRTMIHPPSEGPEGPCGVLVAGDIGLQRLHPGRPLAVSAWLRSQPDQAQAVMSDDADIDGDDAAERPADGGDGGDAGGGSIQQDQRRPQLLLEYCSRPLPQMVPHKSANGRVETEMVFPARGRAGAVTLYMSQSVKALDASPRTVHGGRMLIAIPTEEVVLDLMLPAGWTDPASARVAVYGRRHNPEHVYEERKIDLFPQRETVTYHGAVENVPAISGAAHHQQAVHNVLTRYGWAGKRFDVYRCRVMHPVLHTLLVLRVDPASGHGE
jgi:hypothetical protein